MPVQDAERLWSTQTMYMFSDLFQSTHNSMSFPSCQFLSGTILISLFTIIQNVMHIDHDEHELDEQGPPPSPPLFSQQAQFQQVAPGTIPTPPVLAQPQTTNPFNPGPAVHGRTRCYPCYHARKTCDPPVRKAEAEANGIDITTTPVC